MSKKKNLKSDFEESLEILCDDITEQIRPHYHSNLQPFDAYANFLKDNLKNQMRLFKDSFVNGYQLVLENIAAKKPSDEEQSKYMIPDQFFENINQGKDPLKENETIQDVLGYTNEMMAEIYSLAHHYHEEGNQEKSANLFVYLTTLNPYGGWFWLGLGNALQAQTRYDEALYAFAIALNCIPYESESYCSIARCYLERKNFDEAINILKYGLDVVEISKVKDQLKDLEHNLRAMIVYIEKLKRGQHAASK